MDKNPIQMIGVLGSGTMGHGIAQCFALKGYPVKIFDKDPQALTSTPERIRASLEVFKELALIRSGDISSCLENLTLCRTLDEWTRDTDLIFESVNEDLELKRRVFADLEARIKPSTILCTNTSAISITEISQGLKRRERLVGTHFWNPPSILPCVEVIRSRYTAEPVFNAVVDILRTIGKEPVRVYKDIPGFVGNRMQHALQREAMSLVEKGIADPEDVDRVVKFGFGLRLALMGPLERADLGGLDITFRVQDYLLEHLENRTEPSSLLKDLVEKGHLGVKTGQGYYAWSKEKTAKTLKERDRLLLSLLKLVAGRQG